MTDRIDAESNGMQATYRESMIYSVSPNPTLQQLPPSNYPMLSSRQLRNDGIGSLASSPQPAYIAG